MRLFDGLSRVETYHVQLSEKRFLLKFPREALNLRNIVPYGLLNLQRVLLWLKFIAVLFP